MEQPKQRKHPKAVCEKCPFYDRPHAKTTGPTDAKIAVVSRSPGYHEAMQGKAFAGLSGKVLDHLLLLHGAPRETVLATNVVLCQSDGADQEKGNAFAEAMACCEPRLEAEIAGAETVIACGTEAAWAVAGVSNIGQNRGYVHNRRVSNADGSSGKTQRVVVSNNPAVVTRNDATYPDMVRDFRLAIAPLPEPKLPKVRFVETVADAEEAVAQMLAQLTANPTLIATDLETRGTLDASPKDIEKKKGGLRHTAQIVCAGFAARTERAVIFGEDVCTDEKGLALLAQLWDIPGCTYLWHNGKYDTKVLETQGIPHHLEEDTMLLSWCLDERPGDPESGAGGHSLGWLLKDELGWPNYEPASVKHFKKTGGFDYYGDTPEQQLTARHELYKYNGFDCAGSLGLFEVLRARAINDNVWDRPYKLMLPALSETLMWVELEGNLFDSDRACDILEDEVWPTLRRWRNSLREQTNGANPKLNPNSPKQVNELIYGHWGFKHSLSRPKVEKQGKQSFDKWVRAEVLEIDKFTLSDPSDEARAAFTKFVSMYHDFKELDTQRGTFFEGLILRRFPNGRIYTDFKIHGTESGRISSSNPNLQNVTRPKAGIPSIRSAFIPDPGCVFLSADLSQAELRTIAVLSGDNGLQSIYRDTGRSLHKEVAAEFYGDDYTYEQYVRSKNINFGVAYWQSAYTFAQMYHMPQSEAQGFIDFWWERFPQVYQWTKDTEAIVLSEGELQSPFGHKRRFYVIPADEGGRLHMVKQGINFKPQNIAANITLWALIKLARHLKNNDMWHIAQPRITVHDSILLNVLQGHEEEIGSLVKGFMESAPMEAIGWSFPYLADLSTGPHWGDLKEFTV